MNTKDVSDCLIRMYKNQKNEGKDFDSFGIYKNIYDSFPSYRHLITEPNYPYLMDHKYLQSVLGTMEFLK